MVFWFCGWLTRNKCHSNVHDKNHWFFMLMDWTFKEMTCGSVQVTFNTLQGNRTKIKAVSYFQIGSVSQKTWQKYNIFCLLCVNIQLKFEKWKILLWRCSFLLIINLCRTVVLLRPVLANGLRKRPLSGPFKGCCIFFKS